MDRPGKHHMPYTGNKEQQEAAFRDDLDCVSACFGESLHTEDRQIYRERKNAVANLHEKIKAEADADTALWEAVIAYQNDQFHTSSGLLFTYTIKKNKRGEYSGELIVSRTEGSKTLTRSSVMLAFHKVVEEIRIVNDAEKITLICPEYKGPKAIGQIFGISYVYSLFWKLGVIRVPESVEMKLKGKKDFPDN
jgi:hypothetical protein